MKKLMLGVLAIAITLGTQGCSTGMSEREAALKREEAMTALRIQELAEIQKVLQIDRNREYASSWERTQRGGAAMRPPAYEHVLGSERLLQDQTGPMYPELQPKPANVIDQYMLHGPVGVVTYGASENRPTFTSPGPVECQAILDLDQKGAIVSARSSVPNYLNVKQKLCRGQERLTYAEWEVLLNGTPKDVPLYLQYQGSKNGSY